MNLHKPVIETDGGPWATHDMACAVCHERKAIIDLGTGVFAPCGYCRADGWRILHRKRWSYKLGTVPRMRRLR